MIVIGEQINATRKKVGAAIANRDDAYIVEIARAQANAGAHYLDVNGGDPDPQREVQNVLWLMGLVRGCCDLPVAIDSANPNAVAAGLGQAPAGTIVNSISLESDRLSGLLPLVSDHDCMVVALLMSDDGTPSGADDRLDRAEALIAKLTEAGKSLDQIIVDPCVLPVSTDSQAGRALLDSISEIRRRWPEVHVGGGLSNISFGLPRRKLVNRTALAQCIAAGMDAAIADPCAEGIMETIYAARALAGQDEYCMNYVEKMR